MTWTFAPADLVSETPPPAPRQHNHPWLDISVDPHVWRRWDDVEGVWVPALPSVAIDATLTQLAPMATQQATAVLDHALHIDATLTQQAPMAVQAAAGQVDEPDMPVPANLRETNRTATSITVQWDPVPGVDGYEVEVNGGTPIARGPGQTWLEISGLNPDTTYTFRVRSVFPAGTSDWSAPLQVDTLSGLELDATLAQHAPMATQSVSGTVDEPAPEPVTATLGQVAPMGTQQATAAIDSPTPVGDALLTENGDTLTTEAGDRLLVEA